MEAPSLPFAVTNPSPELDGLLVAVYRSSLIADLIMDIPQGIHDIAFGPRVSQRLSNREPLLQMGQGGRIPTQAGHRDSQTAAKDRLLGSIAIRLDDSQSLLEGRGCFLVKTQVPAGGSQTLQERQTLAPLPGLLVDGQALPVAGESCRKVAQLPTVEVP
jgi:hypothetical protein